MAGDSQEQLPFASTPHLLPPASTAVVFRTIYHNAWVMLVSKYQLSIASASDKHKFF